MRRQSNRLTVNAIKAALRRAPEEGKVMLNDGNGLYVQVKDRVPSWIFRYALNGRTGWMGLGALDTRNIDLAAARELAEDARRLKRRGIDPLAHRRTGEQTGRALAAKAAPSFTECARRYIAAHRAGWKSAKHASQWSATLEADVFPVFGKLPVDIVDTGLVLRALDPIWQTKPVTAGRVRARIENVLDWARSAGFRDGDNPARWKGHLENLLANPGRLHDRRHFPALPHGEIATLLTGLRRGTDGPGGIAAQALDFLILTAARTGEVLGARWEEIDLGKRLWTIPANRMKAGREHRVPLSPPAMAIVERMVAQRQGDLVFPGSRGDRPLVHTALRRQLNLLGHGAGLTVHGFRSTFRSWAAEETSFPGELAEMALGHIVGSAVEQAYQRSDLFEKRRQLIEAWASYCNQAEPTGQVVAIGAARN